MTKYAEKPIIIYIYIYIYGVVLVSSVITYEVLRFLAIPLFRFYAHADDFSCLPNCSKSYRRLGIVDHFGLHECYKAEQQVGHVCSYGF